jgi:hypothetical protein
MYICIFIKELMMAEVAHSYNPSTQKAEPKEFKFKIRSWYTALHRHTPKKWGEELM